MCLRTKESQKDFFKWLKKQPDEITAWKIATKCHKDGRWMLTPSVFANRQEQFERKNRITEDREYILTGDWWDLANTRKRYKPYYHLWLKKPRLSSLRKQRSIVIKCVVPKRLITAKGTNAVHHMGEPLPTIVAKGFDIRPKHWTYRKYFREKSITSKGEGL